MARQAGAAIEAEADRPRRRRLTAEARRTSILQAARRAFTETGDMNGTTIRVIAAAGGISEGVIYRHFESKDQLFYEAVVEPLRASIDDLVASTEAVRQVQPITAEQRAVMMADGYRQLVSTFEEIIPLLGLVLFGDPQVAKRFYDETFAVAMDRLAAVWQAVSAEDGVVFDAPDISARAMMGVALVLALESRHNPRFDRERALRWAGAGTLGGFFPGIG
jgi:AcrR family transcriptional regulator